MCYRQFPGNNVYVHTPHTQQRVHILEILMQNWRQKNLGQASWNLWSSNLGRSSPCSCNNRKQHIFQDNLYAWLTRFSYRKRWHTRLLTLHTSPTGSEVRLASRLLLLMAPVVRVASRLLLLVAPEVRVASRLLLMATVTTSTHHIYESESEREDCTNTTFFWKPQLTPWSWRTLFDFHQFLIVVSNRSNLFFHIQPTRDGVTSRTSNPILILTFSASNSAWLCSLLGLAWCMTMEWVGSSKDAWWTSRQLGHISIITSHFNDKPWMQYIQYTNNTNAS